MKRLFVWLCFGILVLLSWEMPVSPVQAQPLMQLSLPSLNTSSNQGSSKEQKALFEQIQEQVMPEIEAILYPEQYKQLETAINQGMSLRKAFKSLNLTPEEKTKLVALFKSIPKSSMFASLTPEQKKQLFLKKKEFFKPTADEIKDKTDDPISAKR
ncbi:MAG: hypothetical protein IGS38_14985 [Synechococcales cyanobacterium M58_A2018_015]|nr:hypothetical protein [Synechococcales cyanobacterium M58_A2018_015]